MVLPELQKMATGMGISGISKMRKGDLIAAIKERQGGAPAANGTPHAGAPRTDTAPAPQHEPVRTGPDAARQTAPAATEQQPVRDGGRSEAAGNEVQAGGRGDRDNGTDRQGGRAGRRGDAEQGDRQGNDRQGGDRQGGDERQSNRDNRGGDNRGGNDRQSDSERDDRQGGNERQSNRDNRGGDRQGNRNNDNDRQGNRNNDNDRQGNRNNDNDRQGNRNNDNDRQGNRNNDNDRQGNRNNDNDRQGNRNNDNDRQNSRNDRYDDDDDNQGGRGRRRRRGRDRNRNDNRGGNNNRGNNRGSDRYDEPQVSEDDVLIPIAGILDILDNYAFVRTSGYLTGSNDVYVSLSQVRKYSLRRGDAITGAVKAPREGERREKFNALVRLDSVNGLSPDQAKNRPEFTKLTPLYPQKRLRLETEPNILTTRIIDLVMPIGKGQRALVVSPPKAGKTSVLQAIANAITTNNPECHLMVVLVDERPEEVTDMQRSVKGEVIASTFDRPPTDHTTVAELSIERAKRLVELGHDVVVLLDSITRLGRAYNLAAPTSGRILSGGVDSTALYPPKRFLGAARNIENGGSLTIIATALVETGSMMDTVIFEEFKGTGNAELKLDRRIADKRVFPAVDVDASGTRKEEILLSREELAIIIKLRRVLHALDPIEAIDLLISRMKKTANNAEFLMQIAKSTPGQDDD
ncbi:transcription termination factor Rho [Cumulibacter manganitolerans]|uniref:transcription termination factor Rho n=1 Tax=Cumulibacter manganitolerans TaxID=1884992 RepID=UPI001E463D9C|nr:transcription termination factor Rho [Cumulibacter manganitolerans]